MISSQYLFLPILLQMAVIGFDEFYYHQKRDLPRWERIGHPLDTLSVLVCLVWVWAVPPTPKAVLFYAGLSAFSCLFILKDEWLHQQVCEVGENWLHAIAYLLHPLVFISVGLLWAKLDPTTTVLNGWIRSSGNESYFLELTILLLFLFGIYEVIYWNFIRQQTSSHQIRLFGAKAKLPASAPNYLRKEN